MADAFLVDAVRTPVGRLGGALSTVRPDDLAAHVMHVVLARTGVDPAAVEDVIFGCTNQAGEDNRNVARMALLLAGLPDSVPGVTVNRLCGSGLEAVIQAARAIRTGDADLILAGGVESMSRAPYSLPKGRRGNVTAYDTALGWRYPNPRMAERFPLEGMGQTAENLVERYDIARDHQDAFAFGSHQKALAAIDSGAFAAEIVGVDVPGRKGAITVVDTDEGPRRDTSLEKLARLRAVFRDGGSVTAGNSSTLNDGASAVLVASEAAVRRFELRPLARLRSSAVAGVDPRVMGIGPAPATRAALARTDLRLDQIERIELNEAFAAQSLAVIRELELDPERVNPLGGAIALGHPLGCSGARVLTTLLHAMVAADERVGLATLCIGVGQGIAAIVER